MAKQVELLVLPGALLHRTMTFPLPSDNGAMFPKHAEIIYRYFLASLLNSSFVQRREPVSPRLVMCCGGSRLAQVIPRGNLPALMLKQGSDTSLQIIVIASVVVGHPQLQMFLESVPWTVHAFSVGSHDFWANAKRYLPSFLGSFSKDTVVMILDAYDMLLFPCNRSIVAEYEAFKKDIVISAERSCWPNGRLCNKCTDSYSPGSDEFAACKMFPYLNSGGFMGRAPALAESLDWMWRQGDSIGEDDQENLWHYYRAFPESVALDHGQRIWSTLLFCSPRHFKVVNCTVVSKYINGDVCFAHANGASKSDILEPVLRKLEAHGCRRPRSHRSIEQYFGLTMAVRAIATTVPPWVQ